MKRPMHRILAALVGLCCLALPAFAGSDKSQGLDRASQLVTALKALVPPGQTDQQLWTVLVSPGDPQMRVASGLVLADRLYPQGDLSRWDEVQGWWLPQQIPKSLAAADAALYTAVLAVQLPDPAGPWLSFRLLDSFFDSDGAWAFFGRCPPGPVADLEDTLSARGVQPSAGWPPFGAAMGPLPLGVPLYGDLSADQAVAMNLFFLDGMGCPTQGGGFYAWDRLTGRIYRLRETDKDH